jgi:predicted enzyme related to lactoylglutathione lyase
MAGVVGIGGVFFRAHDPDALQPWYVEVLGVGLDSANGAWFRRGGDNASMVFELSPHSNTYIGDAERQTATVNSLVSDMDGIIERLAGYGVTAEPIESESYGRFSWANDPEGNRFELWEPAST